MNAPFVPRRRAAHRSLVALGAWLCLGALLGAGPSGPRGLPAIVFVSRAPIVGDTTAIPGLGPHHRASATPGRLLVRESNGRVRELAVSGRFRAVSDPAVSPNGRQIAFAGLRPTESSWRIWVTDLEGRALTPATGPGSADDAAAIRAGTDDLDPCWLDDSLLCFASTRFPERAEYADVPVTNLYLVDLRGGPPRRITCERNGAEEPTFDTRTGRIVFARWWFNRERPSDRTPNGLTTDPALAVFPDTINLWQAMEMFPDGHDARLAAAELRTRRGSMAYQPAVLASGTIAGVYAANLGLSPRPSGTGIQTFPRRFGLENHLAGAIVPGAAGDAYGGAQGLAAPSACAPAGLPDGRVLFSYSPGARGDFGLYVARADGSQLERVLDEPGALELDAAPIVRRTLSPTARAAVAAARRAPERPPLPARTEDFAGDGAVRTRGTFRFHDLNVYAAAPMGAPFPDPPRAARDAHIRFFASIARPAEEGGDTTILVREARIGADGAVDESGLPADVPMFEQLVDVNGHVLRSAHAAAHVAGLNSGVPGGETRCIGCHTGHSMLLGLARRGGTR